MATGFTAESKYIFPCGTFYASLTDGDFPCRCPDGYTGAVPHCVLQIHRYPFFELSSSTTVADVADVSIYNGTSKPGTVVNSTSNVSIYNGTSKPGTVVNSTSMFDNHLATFDGFSFISFPNDLFEKSPMISFEFWVTTVNYLNTFYERILHFQPELVTYYKPQNSFTLNRDLDSNVLMVDVCGESANSSDCNRTYTTTNFDSMDFTHVVLTIDPEVSKRMKVYVDSNLHAAPYYTREFDTSFLYHTLTLGGNYNLDRSENLNGEIHEFSVWKGAMDSETITSRYLNARYLQKLQMPSSVPTSAPITPSSAQSSAPSRNPTPKPTPHPTYYPTAEPTPVPSTAAPTVSTYIMRTIAGNFECERPPDKRVLQFGGCRQIDLPEHPTALPTPLPTAPTPKPTR